MSSQPVSDRRDTGEKVERSKIVAEEVEGSVQICYLDPVKTSGAVTAGAGVSFRVLSAGKAHIGQIVYDPERHFQELHDYSHDRCHKAARQTCLVGRDRVALLDEHVSTRVTAHGWRARSRALRVILPPNQPKPRLTITPRPTTESSRTNG